jgi:hypothetical protein
MADTTAEGQCFQHHAALLLSARAAAHRSPALG